MTTYLTNNEKDKLVTWEYKVNDRSLTTYLFDPFYNYIVTKLPKNVAPNILTIAGFICTMYSYYLSSRYFDIYPQTCCLAIALLTFLYMSFDAIDGKQARRIKNSTPVGELLDHIFDNIGVIFMIINLCKIFGIDDELVKWNLVGFTQIVFLLSHIDGFDKNVVDFGLLSGPGEFLIGYILIALLRSQFDFNEYINFANVLGKVAVLLFEFSRIVLYYKIYSLKNHSQTKFNLIISLILIDFPRVFYLIKLETISELDIILMGMLFSVLTGDLILSKMAGKEVHHLIPIIISISLFGSYFGIIISILYHVLVVIEIVIYMDIPMFIVF